VDGKEPFLSRWSRRKLQAKEDAPAVAPQAVELPAVEPAAQLPPATEATAPGTSASISSEYREFFDPQVEEKLRRTALKKLFGDPHFNLMDGLDTYIDDYSIPDPIPEAMLRQLNQAKDLLLFEDEQQASERAGEEAAAGGDGPAAPAVETDATTPLEAPAASASDEAAGAAAGAAAVVPAQSSRNN
jgi:hypothetical protein